jgi:glycosyltransferase involved in cell wall biosynthesis
LTVSIVIPTTLDRATVDLSVTAALSAVSTVPGGEVLLMTNGPAEARRPVTVRSPRLRVIESPVGEIAAARNLGLRKAHNDVVLFTDDDCLVEAGWCDGLATRLREGAAAVATPIDVRREGPVTTFLDYQRVFYPPPIDSTTVRFPVGASGGVRRDLIGVSFDEAMHSGEDAEFGSRLHDAGIAIAMAEDAPPPIHLVPERLESITARFANYGAGNARLFLRNGRTSYSVPYATVLYASLCTNEIVAMRRFEEIVDPAVRERFAIYDLLLLAGFLVGYLSEAGEILGREIIRVEGDRLADGWGEIERSIGQEPTRVRDWEQLALDFDRWSTPRAGKRPALATDLAENLSRYAGLIESPRPDPELDGWGDQAAREADETWESANRIWRELREGRLVASFDAIASRLRESGVAFREGAQMIETIAQGPVQSPVVA